MENVKPEELNQRLHDKDHDEILIDVRGPNEYKDAAIPEASNMPLDELADSIESLRKYATVYVTCGTGVRSKKACEILESRGLKHIVNVEGGLTAWQRAGLKTKGDHTGRLPIIRQVMLAAGILDLIGIGFALTLHASWILLSIVVGLGLTFAGATGICFMAYMLEKMPWNRS